MAYVGHWRIDLSLVVHKTCGFPAITIPDVCCEEASAIPRIHYINILAHSLKIVKAEQLY